MRKNRIIAALVSVAMITGLLGGCGLKGSQNKTDSIFTGDPDALQIFVRNNATYADKLVKKFPDIKFDFYYYGGLNTSMAMNLMLDKDDYGDICITSLQATDKAAEEHLLDLSGSEICGTYEPSILSQFDINGAIYQLPGYVTMRNIVYNKDMFRKYGWDVPQNFDEMVQLCRQIRKDAPDITPIVMGGGADGYYFTTMTSYAQAEFLYTQEGQRWTKAYQEGHAKAEEGFGKGIQMTQELIDAGAFDYEANEGLWDSELFRQRMVTEEAAMMFVWGAQSEVSQQIEENKQTEFGMIPFRNRKGQAFIGTNIPYYIGLAKELGEKGNEKKLKQAMKVVEWLSTEEGIKALSTDTMSAILPLKGAEQKNVLKINRDFWNTYLDSIKAPMLYSGYEEILAPSADTIVQAVKGEARLDHLAEQIDEVHGKFIEGGAAAVEVGSFAKNFTHEETVKTMAHILHSKGDSDITLVSDGSCKNGVLNTGGIFLKFFEGPILADQLSICVPGNTVTDPMQQMKLTGREIKALLENGKHRVLVEGMNKPLNVETAPNAVAEEDFDYYWAGMTVERTKDKVKSMKLDDGRVVEEDQIYTVTFAEYDYTEEVAKAGKPVELPYTAEDVLEEYLKNNSPVSPVADK